METEELAQEVEGEVSGTETEESGGETSGSSIDDDWKSAFEGSESEDSDGAEDEETTSETVERLFKEGKEEQEKNDPINQAQETELDKPTATEDVLLDGVTPPSRLDADERKDFARIKSKRLRKSVQKMFKNHESGHTKFINDEKVRLNSVLQNERRQLHQVYNEATKEVHGIRQAVEPYLDKLTFNGQKAIGESIGELAATHTKLTSKDPKVAIPELKRIAGYLSKRFQSTPEKLFGLIDSPDSQSNEVIRTLQGELQSVKSELNRIKTQPQVELVRRQVEAVRQEKDATGQPLFPELYNTDFLVRVNPLVEQIMRANPGMNYGDAHKQAVYVSRGTSPNPTAPRLPAATTQTNGNKPSGSNSGSVRGRSASPSGKFDVVKDAPKNGSIHSDWDFVNRSM